MKRGSGIKTEMTSPGKHRGIEIRIADAFTIIKPTSPFKLAKHEDRRKPNWSDSFGNSLDKTDTSRCTYENKRRIKSSYKRPVVSTVKGMKAIGSG